VQRFAINFSYHFSRILTSLLTNKAYYGEGDVASINIESIDKKVLNYAEIVLLKVITEHFTSFPDENIINVSKTKKFSDMVSSELEALLPSDDQEAMVKDILMKLKTDEVAQKLGI
jgi:hypothetical protein